MYTGDLIVLARTNAPQSADDVYIVTSLHDTLEDFIWQITILNCRTFPLQENTRYFLQIAATEDMTISAIVSTTATVSAWENKMRQIGARIIKKQFSIDNSGNVHQDEHLMSDTGDWTASWN